MHVSSYKVQGTRLPRSPSPAPRNLKHATCNLYPKNPSHTFFGTDFVIFIVDRKGSTKPIHFMKKLYTGIAAVFIAVAAYSQTPAAKPGNTTAPPSNCYTKWEQKFEERGAEDVKDGVYEDIIITVRNGPDAQCYAGKVEVKDGKITAMYRRLQDGTYEVFKPKLKYDVPMVITNGISATLLTMDDELINVIFPKTLKPKKVGYSSAPEPPED